MPQLSPATPLRNDRLRLISVLCAASNGQIWRAIDVPEGKVRAVKAIPLENGGAEAVANEANAIACVQHPLVIHVTATFVEADHGFIVMELAACNLATLVDVCGPLPLPRALRLALDLAGVLSAAHAACVLHRDVKPHNVLIMADGTVRLADFGIAQLRAAGHSTTRASDLLGTMPYMAPEQRRRSIGLLPAADFYALAATLALALTGRPPGDLFHAPEAQRLAELHPALPALMAQAAAYEPSERIAELGALERAIEALGLPVADAESAQAALRSDARATTSSSAAELGPLQPPGPAPAPEGADAPRPPDPAPSPPLGSGATEGSMGRAAGPRAWFAGLGAAAAAALGLALGRGTAPAATDPWAEAPRCANAAARFAARSEPGPLETVAATVADLDDDGLLDVMFSNQLSETLTVWWGERGAMPAQFTELRAGRHHQPPAVVDYNSDGRPDLIVAQPALHSLHLVVATGPRRFGPPQPWFQSPAPDAVSARDLDGDGAPELLAFSMQNPELLLRWGGPDGPGLHRTIATLGPGARWLAADPLALEAWALDPRGLLRYTPTTRTGGPQRRLYPTPGPVAAVLTIGGDPGGVGLLSPSPRGIGIFRLDKQTGAVCALGQLDDPLRPLPPLALADLDQDGVIDAVGARTCSHCASNQIFLRGERD